MTDLRKLYEAETGHKRPERWDTWAFIGWFDEYANWLEYQITWRPVSEKPEEGQVVFGRYNDDICGVLTYEDIDGEQCFIDEDGFVLDVTHWLPIPKGTT